MLIINKKNIPDYRVNHQIKVPEVRLIDDEGRQIGVLPIAQALEMAQEKGLDLVEVNPKADPPVCKILDYGQWLYSQSKQKKNKGKKSETKGIRLTYNMGEHDLQVRVKQAEKFLKQGHRIKAEIIMVGRQKAHPDKAKEILENFQEMLVDKIKIEQAPKKEGNKFVAIYLPAGRA